MIDRRFAALQTPQLIEQFDEPFADPSALPCLQIAAVVASDLNFCLTGDGICVGRDSASAVTPQYQAPFTFSGGVIDKVVVDVSGRRYIDHEAQVRAWFSLD